MSKKDFSGALRKTNAVQKDVIADRFAKADSVLLAMKTEPAESAQEPLEAPAATIPSPAPVAPAVEPPAASVTAEVAKSNAVVRDTFSMPPSDYELIELLRTRAAREGRNTNKSEIVRAGLRNLASLPPAQLLAVLEALERIKPGRK